MEGEQSEEDSLSPPSLAQLPLYTGARPLTLHLFGLAFNFPPAELTRLSGAGGRSSASVSHPHTMPTLPRRRRGATATTIPQSASASIAPPPRRVHGHMQTCLHMTAMMLPRRRPRAVTHHHLHHRVPHHMAIPGYRQNIRASVVRRNTPVPSHACHHLARIIASCPRSMPALQPSASSREYFPTRNSRAAAAAAATCPQAEWPGFRRPTTFFCRLPPAHAHLYTGYSQAWMFLHMHSGFPVLRGK
ncbi:hypothetical protein M433DRAFT_195184 [Acidomyces richmondensis BFW]|nr:MAG: hypothetical protein FE78DRAFT_347218 [Acidomyces sp. 'richmondensis']KYG46568.1 hypothetical protein M433DRAFT_195184 [Acidomyces richmondensis BFW]